MEKTAHQSFTELGVWKKARGLKIDIRQLVRDFPQEEKYRLADQITRSVRSICANVAKGHGRFTNKDQIHFCIQARGSLSETYNHLINACDEGYITKEHTASLKIKTDEVERLLNGYISYLRRDAS